MLGGKKMTFQDLICHLYQLYGRRNRIFLQNLEQRILFLNIAIGDLQKANRLNANKFILSIILARIFARAVSVSEHFKDLKFYNLMIRKYPCGSCSYCGGTICKCPNEYHLDGKLSPVSSIKSEQYNWSLYTWCKHLESIYGEKNEKQHLDSLTLHLFSEGCELASYAGRIPSINDIEKIELKFSLEISDVIAWNIGIANYLKINIEKAVLDRYYPVCWKCRQNPCNCGYFDFKSFFDTEEYLIY
jgi:NTP pyrophosphatase (non-canonical NTP hydrolase)